MSEEYFVMLEDMKEKHENICSKLADIRNLFDESDMEAEGHGMEDMIADPYAVACYAESKLKRIIEENKQLKKELEEERNPFKDIEKWARIWAEAEREKRVIGVMEGLKG